MHNSTPFTYTANTYHPYSNTIYEAFGLKSSTGARVGYPYNPADVNAVCNVPYTFAQLAGAPTLPRSLFPRGTGWRPRT